MLVEACKYFNAGGAVVDLVQPSPQKWNLMASPVPPVIDKGDCNVADESVGCHAVVTEMPQSRAGEPSVPRHRRNPRHERLNRVQADRTWPPALRNREAATRIGLFPDQHCHTGGEHKQYRCHRSPDCRAEVRRAQWERSLIGRIGKSYINRQCLI